MEAARGSQLEKETEEAIDSLDRLVNTYPQSVLAPVAYLKLGDLHASLTEGPKYDQASTKEAMTYYEDFMILYPGDAGIATAASGVDKMKTILSQSKIYIGDYYFYKRLNFVAAKVFYNEAITAYPDSQARHKVRAKKRLSELESRKSSTGRSDPMPTTAPFRRSGSGSSESAQARPIPMTRAWSPAPCRGALLAQGCSHYRLGAGPAPDLLRRSTSSRTKRARRRWRSRARPRSSARWSARPSSRTGASQNSVDSRADADATLEVTLVRKYRRDNSFGQPARTTTDSPHVHAQAGRRAAA